MRIFKNFILACNRIFKTIKVFDVKKLSVFLLTFLICTHSAPDLFVSKPLGSASKNRSLQSSHTRTDLENKKDIYFQDQAAQDDSWTINLNSFSYDSSYNKMFIQPLKKNQKPKPFKKVKIFLNFIKKSLKNPFFGSKKQKSLIKEINSISFQQCWKKPVFSQDCCIKPERFQVLVAEKKKLNISIDMKCKLYVGEPYQLSSHEKVRRWLESL